jgi:hypothetical protein
MCAKKSRIALRSIRATVAAGYELLSWENYPMVFDDPKIPEFVSWSSYAAFASEVRRSRRYVWSYEIQAFLDTVLATIRDRGARIAEDTILFRAQRGIECAPIVDENGDEVGMDITGLGGKRMKPLADRAKEGRANPAGIAVLYLASQEQTAISEIRPWVGSEVSVAQFKVRRELRVINLSLGHGQTSVGHLMFSELSGDKTPTAEKKEKAVWIEIDNAFSRPITLSDDEADYVPTQILAELFRHAGFDAIVYRSQFGREGYNIAIFDVADAEPINCAPYSVTGVEVKYREIGNRWYSTNSKE